MLGILPLLARVVVVVAPVEGAAPVDLPAVAAARAPPGLVTRSAPQALSLRCLQEPLCRSSAVGDADAVLRADAQTNSVRFTLVVGEERVSGPPDLLPAVAAMAIEANGLAAEEAKKEPKEQEPASAPTAERRIRLLRLLRRRLQPRLQHRPRAGRRVLRHR